MSSSSSVYQIKNWHAAQQQCETAEQYIMIHSKKRGKYCIYNSLTQLNLEKEIELFCHCYSAINLSELVFHFYLSTWTTPYCVCFCFWSIVSGLILLSYVQQSLVTCREVSTVSWISSSIPLSPVLECLGVCFVVWVPVPSSEIFLFIYWNVAE